MTEVGYVSFFVKKCLLPFLNLLHPSCLLFHLLTFYSKQNNKNGSFTSSTKLWDNTQAELDTSEPFRTLLHFVRWQPLWTRLQPPHTRTVKSQFSPKVSLLAGQHGNWLIILSKIKRQKQTKKAKWKIKSGVLFFLLWFCQVWQLIKLK